MPEQRYDDEPATEAPRTERLQKIVAARGAASRRAAEELILEGRVTVDRRVVTELGTKVDPLNAEIRVNGRLLKQPRPTYLILNKPRGYITTANDPEGRRTVYDLLEPGATNGRVYPVGRLDMDSEGLLLLTNDGELTNRIAHPRYRLDKEYNALVEGNPSAGALARLAHGGFLINGGRTSPAQVTTMGHEAGGTWLKVIIHEGRKRQVRRMLEEIGHPVRRLRRVRLGPLTLAGLPAATHRPLTPEELHRLRRMVGLAADGSAEERATPTETRREPGGRVPTRILGEGRARSTQGKPSGGELPTRPWKGAKGKDAKAAPRGAGKAGGTRAGRDDGRPGTPPPPRGVADTARPERTGARPIRNDGRDGARKPPRDAGGGGQPGKTGGTRTSRNEGRGVPPRGERGGAGKGTGGRGGQGAGGEQPRRARP
jgi:23S rRNA pseudouridine2605 synthase